MILSNIPLSERLRPKHIADYIGQKHLLGEGKLLTTAIRDNKLFSMIFWGPPGVGKTTIARIIANETNNEFLEFSAVNTGIAEIKKIVALMSGGMYTPIIFVDEIHRFNKAQQDAFLPIIESGKIILIGATTENPSFEIIAPLLSRARVFVLKQLDREDLEEVIDRALTDKTYGLGEYNSTLTKDAINELIDGSSGDARRLLNTLEIAVSIAAAPSPSHPELVSGSNETEAIPKHSRNDKKKIIITKENVLEATQQKALGYDKGGEEHYNTISAFIKSMRASNVDAALYYLARMVSAGEDALFIARRMVVFASEDIGMAQPTALVVANEIFKACETIGYPECQINLAHGVTYLAKSPKDRSSHDAYFRALEDVTQYGNLPIPMNLRNAPTKLMKNLGCGEGYEKYSKESLLPDKIKNKKYYDNN